MNGQELLPAADALPLPAPVALLHALLLVTFFLHLLFLNGLLGGVVLTLAARLRSRAPGDSHHLVADRLTPLLPTLFAGTVTCGVAPLLFLQVLFGQFFFTSSVIMAWPWFAVIVLVLLAYYGTYLNARAQTGHRPSRGVLPFFIALLLAAVAFIYTNNTTLMLRPDRWGDLYFGNPGGGNLNLGDPVLWPRYLHMVLGAVAVAGLLTAWLGRLRRKTDPAAAGILLRYGLTAFTWLTTLNIAAGLWFFLALERPVRKLMMGGSAHATGLFGIGFTGAIVVLGLVPWVRRGSGRALGWVTTLTLVLMGDMVLLRDQVRAGYLAEFPVLSTAAVQTQLLNLVLFGVLLIAGLGTVVWLVRQLRRGGGDASPPPGS